MEWSVCCATLVLAAILVNPLMVEGQRRPVNSTGHLMPKKIPRNGGCLDEGYWIIPVGTTVCVASPGWPGRYDNNADVLWQLDSADDDYGSLKVWCKKVKVGKSKNCAQDYLGIEYWGFNKEYCGRKKPKKKFETPSYWMDFYFVSDHKKNSKGFKCTIKALGGSPPPTDPPSPTPAPPSPTPPPGPTPTPNPNCDCGVKNPHRIVGGDPATANEYPWLVGLSSNNQWNSPFCGGSVYNSQWIITAAHCVPNTSPSSIKVVLGMHNYITNTPTPTSMDVTQIIVHEDYNGSTLDNDIALIRVSGTITFNDKVKPVCLPNSNADYAGQEATVTGWGALQSGGSSPNMNHFVKVPIRTEQECDASYPGEITDNMICAGKPDFSVDSCQGDSGGPLTVPVNGHHFLAGIVSWGYFCARDPWYGVYTDVPNYNAWINNHAGGPHCTP